MSVRPSLLALGLIAALLTAGCGSSNKSSGSSSTSGTTASTSGGGATTDLELAALKDGTLKFDKSTLSAPAGKVTLTMANPSPLPHSIAIEGNGVDAKGKVVSTGGSSTVSADVKAGSYTYYCTVPGHRSAGMEGTLTVK